MPVNNNLVGSRKTMSTAAKRTQPSSADAEHP
jgi:hypothetical protein